MTTTKNPKVHLTRRLTFSASHRLNATGLSQAENRKLFGKCNLENGHGHNYVVEVTLFGEVDPRSGMVFSLSELKEILANTIEAELDHKHLNLDVPGLRDVNPTVENLAIYIWRLLETKLPAGLLREVRLSETENNFASYRGD